MANGSFKKIGTVVLSILGAFVVLAVAFWLVGYLWLGAFNPQGSARTRWLNKVLTDHDRTVATATAIPVSPTTITITATTTSPTTASAPAKPASKPASAKPASSSTVAAPAPAPSTSTASSNVDVGYVKVTLKPMPGRSNYGSFAGLLLSDGKADLCFADDQPGSSVTESVPMKPGDYVFNMTYSDSRTSWATDPGNSFILNVNGIDNVINNSFRKEFTSYKGTKAWIYAVRIPSSGSVGHW